MRSRPQLLLRNLLRASGALLTGSALLGTQLEAQTGSITGRITEAQSGQPVSAVQVYIEGLDLGVLSQQNGRYLIVSVPAGTHEVVVERIGYRREVRQVAVTAGGTSVQDFVVSEEALQLDEVIVTGTPGGTQRRAIGNAVVRLDASDVTATRPVSDMQDILQGRTPGLAFVRNSGNLGEGSAIRIRGVSSFRLGTQPLIYVDGVRIDNSTTLGPSLPNLAQTSSGSALDDINPDDIASVEIIKGPAAATLYGTEASAGVIQIITKRGQTGAPQFDLAVTQGTNFLMDPATMIGDQYRCATGSLPCAEGDLVRFNIIEEEKKAGFEPLQNGRSQNYSLSVRGGTDAINYYVSASWDDREGVVDYNWVEQFSARANIGVLISEDVDVDVSVGFSDGQTRYASGSLEGGGLWPHLMWAQGAGFGTPQRGYLSVLPEEFSQIETTRSNNRLTASATLSHTPTEWLRQRLIVGIDRGDEEDQTLFPRDPAGIAGPFGGLSLGDVRLERPINTEITVDYAASVSYQLTEAIGLTSSAGVQYTSSELNRVETTGRIFPSPVIRSIEGATETQATQTFRQNKSLGLYFQQELSWNNRVFLTGAVRGDDNSAFGADYDAAIYPKFSATWTVSEESFWNVGFINSLRLRTAWGQAGRQPGTFDAVTLFSPSVGSGGVAAVTPATLGNPDLGPEVSTELELGFDAAFLDDRISAEFTYYRRRTEDALVSVPLSPTSGFPGSEADNLGRLDTWGYETAIQTRPVSGDSWALDLGMSLSYTMNQIKDLGQREESDQIRAGYPYPNRTTDFIVSYDEATDTFYCDAGTPDLRPGGPTVPCSETEDYSLLLGPTFAPWTWSVDATVTLFNDLQIFGLVDGEHGRWINDYNLSCRTTACGFPNAAKSLTWTDPIYVQSVLIGSHPSDSRLGFDSDASYIKVRELGLRYQLPQSWMQRAGVDRSSITVAARDLWYLWRAQDELGGMHIPSPELSDPTSSSGFALFQWPPLTSIEVALRVSF